MSLATINYHKKYNNKEKFIQSTETRLHLCIKISGNKFTTNVALISNMEAEIYICICIFILIFSHTSYRIQRI